MPRGKSLTRPELLDHLTVAMNRLRNHTAYLTKEGGGRAPEPEYTRLKAMEECLFMVGCLARGFVDEWHEHLDQILRGE